MVVVCGFVMKHSQLITSKRLFLLTAITSIIAIADFNFQGMAGIDNAAAQTQTKKIKKRQTVRFYKVNKNLQADRLRFTNRAASKPGCHNFIKKTRVHRIVQLGYQSCSFYAKKSCLADSILSAVTEKDKTPMTQLTQGVSWFFDQEKKRGERMKSWYCE